MEEPTLKLMPVLSNSGAETFVSWLDEEPAVPMGTLRLSKAARHRTAWLDPFAFELDVPPTYIAFFGNSALNNFTFPVAQPTVVVRYDDWEDWAAWDLPPRRPSKRFTAKLRVVGRHAPIPDDGR